MTFDAECLKAALAGRCETVVAVVKAYVTIDADGEMRTHTLVTGDMHAATASLIELGEASKQINDMTRGPLSS